MSKNLLELLFDETNETRTENMAKAYKTTKSAVLDLFSIGGAARNLDEETVYQKISQALSEDLDLGIRCLLFLSDIREGQGERRLFKIGLKVLTENYDPFVVIPIINNIPHFTRWDYLFEFVGTKYEKYILTFIEDEIKSNTNSLIYKWLPSIQRNTKLAIKIAKYLGLTNKEYRQMLSNKRKELKILERTMSDRRWEDIEYDKIPSKASLLYRNAFLRNDKERYEAFINSVIKGEKKINAGVLYPHDIANKAFYQNDQSLEALWKNLPNYVSGDAKVLPMIDVSGSMTWFTISPQSRVRGLDVAVGMGLYLSERLNEPFKDTFLTFSGEPELVKVTGNSLYQKFRNINGSNWGRNTDIVKAFTTILKVAYQNNLEQSDLPDTIVVFSDMEFDSCVSFNETPFKHVKNLYEKNGYKLPQVVFWNLNGRNIHVPVTQNEKGVILVSGYSPVTLQYVLTGELKTPYELMLDVLMQDRYNIYK